MYSRRSSFLEHAEGTAHSTLHGMTTTTGARHSLCSFLLLDVSLGSSVLVLLVSAPTLVWAAFCSRSHNNTSKQARIDRALQGAIHYVANDLTARGGGGPAQIHMQMHDARIYSRAPRPSLVPTAVVRAVTPSLPHCACSRIERRHGSSPPPS
jgi:hypothetical protein